VPKVKTKTKPKKPNNVVKLEKVKEEKEKPIKEKNFTLDYGDDGQFIKCLNLQKLTIKQIYLFYNH